jgi:hypothetical protein
METDRHFTGIGREGGERPDPPILPERVAVLIGPVRNTVAAFAVKKVFATPKGI